MVCKFRPLLQRFFQGSIQIPIFTVFSNDFLRSFLNLVAPYCAIPRDYLSDTPLLRAMGFLVSQHGQMGAIPPPPLLSISPLESMRSGGAIPRPQKGHLSDTCAIPFENKANAFRPKVRKKSRKGFPGLSAPGAQKSENNRKLAILQFQVFNSVFGFFSDLLGPRNREFPGTHFETGRKVQMTPVNGQRYRNIRGVT